MAEPRKGWQHRDTNSFDQTAFDLIFQ